MRGAVTRGGPARGFLRAVLAVVATASSFDVLAAVNACENTAEHGFELRLEGGEPRPSLDEVPLADRERKYALPIPEDVSADPYSFWDFVPPLFFPAIGMAKSEVESLDNETWRRNIDFFWNLRQEAIARRAPQAINISYRAIDWLYAVARSPDFFSQWEFENDGGVSGIEVAPDQSWNVGNYATDRMNPGRMWIMIASLYGANHPRARHWIDDYPNEYHVPDGYWQRFPDPGAGQAWSLEPERRRLREYLCSMPELKYAVFQAEEYFLKHAEARVQAIGRVQLSNVDKYIADQIADFQSVFALLKPGAPSRASFLTLVQIEDVHDHTRLLQTMENRGAAKTYVALIDRSRDAVTRVGGSVSVVAVWEAMRWSEKYLWPNPCLDQLRFPSFADRLSQNDLAKAVTTASCRLTAYLHDAGDRAAVYRAATRGRPDVPGN